MSDPRRLLDDGPSDLVRAMLVAAREEAPSEASLKRTLTAVGAGAAILGGGAAASATTASAGVAAASAAKLGTASGTATAGLFLKWASVGLATGLATAGVAESMRASDPPPTVAVVERREPSATRSAKAIEADRPKLEPARAAEPEMVPEPQAQTLPPLLVAPKELAVPRAQRAIASSPLTISTPIPTPTPASHPTPSRLASEVAALDRARDALALGRPFSTLAALDAYERETPNGTLAPEALYLRAEALVQTGDVRGAASVARHLLALQPHGPHAPRARAIAEASQRDQNSGHWR